MNLEKYKNHLFQNIKKQLSAWFDTDEAETVPAPELYRFLHSIKGTSGTLELRGLQQISENLLKDIDEDSQETWGKKSLRNFLYDLIELTYEYEHFEDKEPKSKKNSNSPLIQLIDDDVSMLILLKDALEEQGWMVITNTNPEKAMHQYFEMQPDCLISDLHFPDTSGFQVLRDLQEHNEKYFIPKIILSVKNDRETRIYAYKMGADDFISKPVDIEEFVAKVERHLQRKKIFDQSVLIDELTQVYNRRFFDRSLQRFFDEWKRTKQPFTISAIDIDHFKNVNDTYGHQTGDMVLIEFAAFLKTNVRSTDIVYRYGGEEFVIIFPRTTGTEAKTRLTHLIKEFSNQVITSKDGQTFSVTFSAGVFTVEDETATPSSAFKNADQALYKAKNSGRARVESSEASSGSYRKKIMCVTVIDDDVIIRTMLNQILQAMTLDHWELDVADFEDGHTFFQSGRADHNLDHFLILDGVMPVMDGLEVLQKIKKLPNSHLYKILMLTGRKSEYDIARALKLGADDYVTKPFSITELQARIERLLKRGN
ncbi:diguanylate cyclase [Bacillus sp. V5-8f]|uniref:GGDEF domain-containing response regulator n=1 Tax=Bacillus sp. V5-8f TaxID=2053044 RepID=UPI002155AA37|nr:diguanylate cyclase [Bacillus sp. V5-8f]